MMKMNLKFKAQLLVPILSAVILGVGILQYVSYEKAVTVTEEEIFAGIERTATMAANAVDNWITSELAVIHDWAQDHVYGQALQGNAEALVACSEELKIKQKDFPFYESMFLANPAGKVIAAASESDVGLDLSAREYMKKAMSGDLAVSPATLSKATQKPIFVLASPVKVDGKVIGVLIGAVKLSALEAEITKDIKVGSSGYAYIIDEAGTVVSHPKEEFILKENFTKHDFGKYMVETKNGRYKYWWQVDNAFKGQGFRQSKQTGWIVAVTAPLTELLGGLNIIKIYAVVGGLIIVVVVGILVYWLVGRAAKILNYVKGTLDKVALGDLSSRVDGALLARRDEFGDLCRAMDGTLKAQQSKADALTAVSMGDLSKEVVLASGADVVGKAMQEMTSAIRRLVSDAHNLSDAAVKGALSTRADASAHQGDFRAIVEGVNATLDAVIGPLNVAADYVAKISQGNMPPLITATYQGDFNTIKNSLNQCIRAINALITDANVLSDAAVAGQLSTRADASKHEGDFRKIVSGVNGTIETLVGHMNVMMRYLDDIAHGKQLSRHTQDVRGDYQKTKESINTCVDVLTRLQGDALAMADAGAEGRLEQSVNVKSYEGSWQQIASGLNGMMDAVRIPLEEVGRVLQSAADGSLTMSVTGEYQGAFDQLKSNLNMTVGNLNDALVQVAEAVSQVNSGAAQISDASQSLSQGATEQASSLEEITSSVTEIASQTKTNAENANQANSLADSVRKAAEKGSGQMTQMVESMESINASSLQIAKIIKVIDDIAFQTNLLALNAAVEAARAGRHGKGFAVVADEVRNLAGRSAKAAKETAELIESSGAKTQAGMQVANSTAESFKEIVTGIVKTNDLVGEIAAASSEQAQGVSQINIGLSQVDQVTQQNTANAEETASAAEELSSQATHLQGLVARFKLRNQGTRTLPPAQQAHAPTKNPTKSLAKAPAKAPAKVLPKAGTKADKGWGDASKPTAQSDIINLDDNEFGKY